MRHLFACACTTTLMVLSLSACQFTTPPQTTATTTVPAPAQMMQTLHFVGPMDLTLTLSTQDNFATATLTDNSDRAIAMRSVRAGSGMRLEGPNREVIHFKGSEGYVELVPGRQIEIREFQK